MVTAGWYNKLHRGKRGWPGSRQETYLVQLRAWTMDYAWGITHTHGRAIAVVRQLLMSAVIGGWPKAAASKYCGVCDHLYHLSMNRYGTPTHNNGNGNDGDLPLNGGYGSVESHGSIADIIVSYMPLPDHPSYFSRSLGISWQQMEHRAMIAFESRRSIARMAKTQPAVASNDRHSSSSPSSSTTARSTMVALDQFNPSVAATSVNNRGSSSSSTSSAASSTMAANKGKKKKKGTKMSLDEFNSSVVAAPSRAYRREQHQQQHHHLLRLLVHHQGRSTARATNNTPSKWS